MSAPNSPFDKAMNISRVVVVAIGIIGNIISFIVFSRKTFRKNSISTYCRALAIFDCLTIVELIKSVYLSIDFMDYMESWNDASCKLFFYTSMEYTTIPGWILVAFSIDKMLHMRTSCPRIIKSKLFQWSVVAGIVVFHLLFYIELLISLKLEPLPFLPQVQFCNFAFLSYLNILIYAELTDACFIPFAIMIVTSILTIRLLIRSRNSLERIGHEDKKRRMRDTKFAISSLTFSFFFVTFKTPFVVSFILPFDPNRLYFQQIAFVLFLINCSSNFFIHFATNSLFRRELHKLRDNKILFL